MKQYPCQHCDFTGSFRGVSMHTTTKHGDDFDKKPYLKKELRRLYEKNGETPTKRIMNEEGEFATGTYQKVFGSWNEAIKEAGLEVVLEQQNTREEMLEELKRVKSITGSAPTYSSVKKHSYLSPDAYRLRFGKFSKAVEEAGMEPYPPNSERTRSSEWREEAVGHPYGPDWKKVRQEAIERADGACEHPKCEKEKSRNGRGLECHHIIPNFLTEDEQEHDLDNILVLCREHHDELEVPRRSKTECKYLF